MDPGRIVVTPGAKPPISYSFQVYVDEGDEVSPHVGGQARRVEGLLYEIQDPREPLSGLS